MGFLNGGICFEAFFYYFSTRVESCGGVFFFSLLKEKGPGLFLTCINNNSFLSFSFYFVINQNFFCFLYWTKRSRRSLSVATVTLKEGLPFRRWQSIAGDSWWWPVSFYCYWPLWRWAVRITLISRCITNTNTMNLAAIAWSTGLASQGESILIFGNV